MTAAMDKIWDTPGNPVAGLKAENDRLKEVISDWLRAHDAIIALHRDGMEHRDYAHVVKTARRLLGNNHD